MNAPALVLGEDLGIVPPNGCSFVIVPVVVDQGVPWDQAIKSAAPDTPDSYRIYRVAGHYLLESSARVKRKIGLLYAMPGKDINFFRADAWAKSTGHLRYSHPRDALAFAKSRPVIHRELDLRCPDGMNAVSIVSTIVCNHERLPSIAYWDVADDRNHPNGVRRVAGLTKLITKRDSPMAFAFRVD